MIKSKEIQKLYMTMGMCESSLDFILMYKDFLEDVGIDTRSFGINKIIVSIVSTLRDNLGIDEVILYDYDHCDQPMKRYINLNNISYKESHEYDMGENRGFKIVLKEPPFNVENLTQDNDDFILGIQYLEFVDGTKVKISELGTDNIDRDLSELDTFFSMIDMTIYRDILNLMHTSCKFVSTSECDVCGHSETEMVDDYIVIINKILMDFLE